MGFSCSRDSVCLDFESLHSLSANPIPHPANDRPPLSASETDGRLPATLIVPYARQQHLIDDSAYREQESLSEIHIPN
jgi:hypothetical protein